jgi:hypothetical protein
VAGAAAPRLPSAAPSACRCWTASRMVRWFWLGCAGQLPAGANRLLPRVSKSRWRLQERAAGAALSSLPVAKAGMERCGLTQGAGHHTECRGAAAKLTERLLDRARRSGCTACEDCGSKTWPLPGR